MALRSKVVDLVGTDIEDEVCNILAVGEVTVMEEKIGVGFVRIDVNMVNPFGFSISHAIFASKEFGAKPMEQLIASPTLLHIPFLMLLAIFFAASMLRLPRGRRLESSSIDQTLLIGVCLMTSSRIL